MGRNRSSSPSSRRKETKEERLVRKAKAYIEEKEGKQKKKSEERHHRDKERKSKKRPHREKDRKDRDESEGRKHKKHRHDSKKSKKSDDKKRYKPDKNRLVDLGSQLGKKPEKALTMDDYFSYHQHLWVYLYREEGLAFNDLKSDETHKAFERFCKAYNRGRLEVAYYEGLPAAALEECKTTQHTWNFRTTDVEERNLQYLQEGIHKQTEYQAVETETHVDVQRDHLPQGEKRSQTSESDERPPRTAEDRYQDRLLNRRMKSHVKNVMEELDGGPRDFKEKQRDKRREVSARMHAASREKDGAGVELTDEGIYGGEGDGDVGFQKALAREKARKERKDEEKLARVRELQDKEAKKQDDMLKMLGIAGIQPGQKIKIAPRKDN